MVEWEKGEPIVLDDDHPLIKVLEDLKKTYEAPKNQEFLRRIHGEWLDG